MVAEPAVQVAVELARRLPAGDITRRAEAAAGGPMTLADLRARAAGPVLRSACDRVAACAGVPGERLAGMLLGAVVAYDDAARSRHLDVVWTGPESEVQTSRLTAATVVEIIDRAERELILVSYASVDEPG